MYRQGGSRAEMWRLKSVPPVAFNQERPNLTEGGLDVQGGYLPPCSQGLFRRRDERPRGGPSVRATPGHGAQDARVLRAPRVSTATTGSQTEARSMWRSVVRFCSAPLVRFLSALDNYRSQAVDRGGFLEKGTSAEREEFIKGAQDLCLRSIKTAIAQEMPKNDKEWEAWVLGDCGIN